MSTTMYELLGLTEDHVEVVCKGCERGCMFCEGGLWACDTCGGLEGAMPTQCPGRAMSMTLVDDVYAGRLDFRRGAWQPGLASIHSPGWYWMPEGRSYAEALLAAENAAAARS